MFLNELVLPQLKSPFYLQNDSKFILHLCTVGYYLGFIPYKPNNTYKISTIRKVYLILLYIIIGMGLFCYYHHYVTIAYYKQTKYQRILTLVTESLNCVILIILLVSINYLSPSNWIDFFNELNKIDLLFNHEFNFINKRYLLVYYFDLFFTLVPVILSFGYMYVLNIISEQLNFVFSVYFNYYYFTIACTRFTTSILISNFLMYIQRRLNHLVKYFEVNIKNYSYLDSNEHEIITEIRNGIKIYRKLQKHFENFITIFSWFLFTYVIYNAVEISSFVYYNVLNNYFQWEFVIIPYLFFNQVNNYKL